MIRAFLTKIGSSRPHIVYHHSDITDMTTMSSSNNNDLSSPPPSLKDPHTLAANTADSTIFPSQFLQTLTELLDVVNININDLPPLPTIPLLTQEWMNNSINHGTGSNFSNEKNELCRQMHLGQEIILPPCHQRSHIQYNS